jgi:hypothetical protein
MPHVIDKFVDEIESDRDIFNTKDAVDSGWLFWLDGIPVVAELRNYGDELRRAFPNLRFLYCKHSTVAKTVWGGVCREVWVCMDSSLLTVARIGYAGYKKGGELVYGVRARGIENNMYKSGHNMYHSKTTSRLNVAVKNALANLVPYSAKEVASATYVPVRDKILHTSDNKRATLSKLLGSISQSVLISEITALRAAGVTFTTQEFQDVVANLDEARRITNGEVNRRVDIISVHVVERGGVTYIECSTVNSVGDNYSIFPDDIPETVVYTVDQVPSEIAEKVAVLQTMDAKAFVDTVGMKVCDKLYWVFK